MKIKAYSIIFILLASFMTVFVVGGVPLASASTTEVFNEGFEGSFPVAPWTVGDSNSDSGLDYWDDNNYRSHGGSWSAWCADIGSQDVPTTIFSDGFEGSWLWASGDWDERNGIDTWDNYTRGTHTGSASAWCSEYGDMPSGEHYDLYMRAYMYRGVSLGSYSSVTLSFWYWIDAETNVDFLQVMYHPSGAEWSEGSWIKIVSAKYTGYQTWTQASVSIPNTANAVGFYFYSDSINVGAGAVVDDVELTGTPASNLAIHKYDNNMGSFMYRSVDLSGYDSASLSYWYWMDYSDGNYDFLEVIYWSAESWHYVDKKTTGSSSWVQSTVSIPTDATFVGFKFTSDVIISSYEGAYIDDVILTAESPPQSFLYDFGTATSPLEPGYIRISHYKSLDRGAPDNLRRDFIYDSSDATFVPWDIPNGDYMITVIIGDNIADHDLIDVSVEGALKINDLTVSAGEFAVRTFSVTLSDGELNIRFHDDGGSDPNWIVNAVKIVPIGVPEYILDFDAFPAYPYNTAAYYSGGRYVGCGPTTGAMIFGYFQHHFGLTTLLDNPVAGVDEGLDTAWELHYNYMITGADGLGSVYYIKSGLEDYASDRGHEVQVMAHAPTWEDPAISWYNDYGAYGDAWLDDGNFWVDLGSGLRGIDENLFCDFLNAKFSQGITVMLTIDSDGDGDGDHWIPCVGFERTNEEYYYYDTYTTSLQTADIDGINDPGAGVGAITFVRTIEYTHVEPLSRDALWDRLVEIILAWPTSTPEQRAELWEDIVEIILLWPTAT